MNMTSVTTYQAAMRPSNQREYSRILTAAVISSQFRQKLLANPEKAITAGYAGEVFHLEGEEKMRLKSIRARSLPEFASALNPTDRTNKKPL
jgi:hypothetical protein